MMTLVLQRTLFMIFFLLAVACGQKGPLYSPVDKNENSAQPTEVTNTL
jgi:predicted small lipoprotein YifL